MGEIQGAKRAREVIFSVLRDAMLEGDLSITKAVAAVKDIFAENAKKLYKLHKLDVSSKDSDEPHISSPFMKKELHGSVKDSSTDSVVEPYASSSFQNEELNGSSKDITLVRMIRVDASGQHRCRLRGLDRCGNLRGQMAIGVSDGWFCLFLEEGEYERIERGREKQRCLLDCWEKLEMYVSLATLLGRNTERPLCTCIQ
ncbi:hypothetical protein HAX54_031508 [Datura stramonium]|uniref:Uncharacterized protein n=1 Tax=Datura stramonium TaxID=4076 RepID=A0ABS8RHE7_DATST|nr:hypothetical protein [Datura stramonium]